MSVTKKKGGLEERKNGNMKKRKRKRRNTILNEEDLLRLIYLDEKNGRTNDDYHAQNPTYIQLLPSSVSRQFSYCPLAIHGSLLYHTRLKKRSLNEDDSNNT